MKAIINYRSLLEKKKKKNTLRVKGRWVITFPERVRLDLVEVKFDLINCAGVQCRISSAFHVFQYPTAAGRAFQQAQRKKSRVPTHFYVFSHPCISHSFELYLIFICCFICWVLTLADTSGSPASRETGGAHFARLFPQPSPTAETRTGDP